MNLIEEQLAYPSKIFDYLFLTGVDFLKKEEDPLLSRDIKYVISVMKNPPIVSNVKQLIIPIEDSEQEKITAYFDSAFKLIIEARKNHSNVLIHCEKGMSRSATIVIGWILFDEHNKRKHVDFRNTFSFVKKQRSVVAPNPGFVSALMKYSDELNANLPNLTSLTHDCYSHIFKSLNSQEFLILSLTCKFFSKSKDDNAIWLYYLGKDFQELKDKDYEWFRQNNFPFKKIYQCALKIKRVFASLKITLPIILGYVGDKDFIVKFLHDIRSNNTNSDFDLIMGAVMAPTFENVKTLKECGIDITQTDEKNSQNILFYAVAANNLSVLRYLDRCYEFQWQLKNQHGDNLLLIASFYGCLESLQFLLEEKKLNANDTNLAGDNILIKIAISGKSTLANYIKEYTVNLDPYQENHTHLSAYKIAKNKENLPLLEIFDNWKPENKHKIR